MKVLDKCFAMQAEIFRYFNYQEDWCVYPLNDRRNYFWLLNQESGEVWFCKSADKSSAIIALCNQEGEVYSSRLHQDRFLPKAVYPSDNYTMVVEDTCTDGNIFLSIFDNSKQIFLTDIPKRYREDF